MLFASKKSTTVTTFCSLKNFARAVKNGLVLHECAVPGLKGILNQLKNEEREFNW